MLFRVLGTRGRPGGRTSTTRAVLLPSLVSGLLAASTALSGCSVGAVGAGVAGTVGTSDVPAAPAPAASGDAAVTRAVTVEPVLAGAAARAAAPIGTGAHNDQRTPFTLSHLPTLMRHRYDGRWFRVLGVDATAPDGAWTRHRIRYRSDSLRITGLLTVPTGTGPHPLLVLAHGFKNPDRYRSGDGLRDEAAALGAAGYVVLQPDYRNHAGSTRERDAGVVRRPRGYPEDLVNALRAVRRARLPFVDSTQVGVLGRSMGGGVALNAAVARPDLVDALVLYSPISSSVADNYRRWVRPRPELRALVNSAYRAPRTNRRFWRRAASRTYLHRLDMPVLVQHGSRDGIAPVRWSRATAAAMRRAGVSVTYREQVGERHRFHARWPDFIVDVTAFFDEHVRGVPRDETAARR